MSYSVVNILITNLEYFQAKIPKSSFSLRLVFSVREYERSGNFTELGREEYKAIQRESPSRMLVKGNPGLKNLVSGADFHFTTRICPGSMWSHPLLEACGSGFLASVGVRQKESRPEDPETIGNPKLSSEQTAGRGCVQGTGGVLLTEAHLGLGPSNCQGSTVGGAQGPDSCQEGSVCRVTDKPLADPQIP